MTRSLAVDLGGTHVRFRLAGSVAGDAPVHVIETSEVESFEDAFGQWRERTGMRGRLDAAAVAVAGPVAGARVRITNLGWTLDARAIERSCCVGRCLLVNDVTAVAWALPALGAGDVRGLEGDGADDHAADGVHGFGADGAEEPAAGRGHGLDTEIAHDRAEGSVRVFGKDGGPRGREARAVIAPGTGLGVSGLVPAGEDDFAAVEGEGGHRTLAARSPREWAIVTALAERFGHASAERALSGPGIEAIYHAITSIDGARSESGRAAAEIARDAFTGSDPIAHETIAVFTGFLGSVAGDLALTLGARGGVYIAGGIVPGWSERFDAERFLGCFRAKGRFRAYLSAIPVHVVTHPYPGLVGIGRLLSRGLAEAS